MKKRTSPQDTLNPGYPLAGASPEGSSEFATAAGLLPRLHYLSLVSRRSGGSPLLRAPRKTLPGGGTELTGYRDYAPGDDWRQIDWTWCARRDEILMKVFAGEADRQIYLLIDASPSMGFGRPPKLRLAARIAAALGYASLARGDRLGVAAFAHTLLASLPPLRHLSRWGRLAEFLGTFVVPPSGGSGRLEPALRTPETFVVPPLGGQSRLKPELQTAGGGRTDLVRSAEALVRRFPHRGPVIVLSDFYDPDGFHRGLDYLRQAGYDPRLVHVFDPRDARSDLLGDLELCDAESQAVRAVTITQRSARRYRALVAEFRARIDRYWRRHGLACMEFPCDAAEEQVLRQVLGATGTVPIFGHGPGTDAQRGPASRKWDCPPSLSPQSGSRP